MLEQRSGAAVETGGWCWTEVVGIRVANGWDLLTLTNSAH